uniref:TPX2 C-terminal domain-containing protein n=1 Tax=Musa acuminata subsp. malaccensis TaxID=214687 RepID=A0A804JZK6_MUSAM
MATDVDQAYQGWSQGELSDGDTSQEIPVSQMLDHGSISFGRFPIESLSWERRSVFTHNRCQEELEKFNGLVAKKKAYFEERYRRIRAMKAQQNVRQNQHTELTLDYGGDGSMSSQSGEEDGAASQHERFKDGASNNVHSIPEETKPGVTLEQEINCNEPPQERCFNPDSTLPNPDSSRGIPENTEQDKNTLDTTMLVQPMETESSLPLTGDLKETKSNSSSKLDNKEILLKPKSLESNIEPRRVAPDTKKIKSEQLQSIRKPLHHKSLSKDPAAVRNGLNMKQETKSNGVHSSKGLKTPSQKTASQTLSKIIASRVKSNAMSTLVDLNQPLTKARSISTTLGPFTLVMERRARSRGNSTKLDSGSSNMLASSQIQAKGGSSVQDTKKTASSSGMTSRRGPETKSLKEVKKKPLAVDSHYANLKKIEAHVLGPPKSRSSELPARNKSICNVGTEPHIATAEGMKRKEGNARMREFQRGTIKTTGPSKSGNMPMDTKQALAGRGADVSRGGSKSKLDDPSLDGRKTRCIIFLSHRPNSLDLKFSCSCESNQNALTYV